MSAETATRVLSRIKSRISSRDTSAPTSSPQIRIPGSPALKPRHLVARPNDGARAVCDRVDVGRRLAYADGKTAFRAVIRTLDGGDSSNVLLPSYVPTGPVSAIRAADARPRFYELESDLGPDVADVRAKLDGDTVAATFVHYFGFPGARFDAFRRAAAERDVPVIVDNAHATFSSDGERLLGTRGAVGFTSVHKTLPVPDGAFLFVNEPQRIAVEDGPPSGRAETVGLPECRYALGSLLAGAKRGRPVLEGPIEVARRLRDRVASDRPQSGHADDPGSGDDPATARMSGRMSRLTTRVIDRIDPAAIVSARRTAYRAWAEGLTDVCSVDPCFEALPPGTSPQVVPAVVDDPVAFQDALDRRGVAGAHTWPPELPAGVRHNEAFPVANHLAADLVALPCHQDVDPGAVRAVCAEL